MPDRLRTIIKLEAFEEDLRAISADPVRADEFAEAAEWVLARDPGMGTQVARDSLVWFLPMADLGLGAQMALYYTFDDERVYFLSVRAAPADAETP